MPDSKVLRSQLIANIPADVVKALYSHSSNDEDEENYSNYSSSSRSSANSVAPDSHYSINNIDLSLMQNPSYNSASSVNKLKRILNSEDSDADQTRNMKQSRLELTKSNNHAIPCIENPRLASARFEMKPHILEGLKCRAYESLYKHNEWTRRDLALAETRLATLRAIKMQGLDPVGLVDPPVGHDLPQDYVEHHFALNVEDKLIKVSNLVNELLVLSNCRLSDPDVKKMLRYSFFMVNLFSAFKVNIDGDSYMFMDKGRVMFGRHWLIRIFGEDLTEFAFQLSQRITDCGMTDREIALLIPCILTLSTPGESFLFKEIKNNQLY